MFDFDYFPINTSYFSGLSSPLNNFLPSSYLTTQQVVQTTKSDGNSASEKAFKFEPVTKAKLGGTLRKFLNGGVPQFISYKPIETSSTQQEPIYNTATFESFLQKPAAQQQVIVPYAPQQGPVQQAIQPTQQELPQQESYTPGATTGRTSEWFEPNPEVVKRVVEASNTNTIDAGSHGTVPMRSMDDGYGWCTAGPHTFYSRGIGVKLNGHWWVDDKGNQITASSRVVDTGIDKVGFKKVWHGDEADTKTEDFKKSIRPGDVVTSYGGGVCHAAMCCGIDDKGNPIMKADAPNSRVWVFRSGTGRRGKESVQVWRYAGDIKKNKLGGPILKKDSGGTLDLPKFISYKPIEITHNQAQPAGDIAEEAMQQPVQQQITQAQQPAPQSAPEVQPTATPTPVAKPSTSSSDKVEANGSNRYNRGNLRQEILELFERELGWKHGREFNLGEAVRSKNAGYGAKKSNHHYGNAVDLTPRGDMTFLKMKEAFLGNANIRKFFRDNGLGILDESTPEIRAKNPWKSTGNHYHIGPDGGAVRTWNKWLDELSAKTQQSSAQVSVAAARNGGILKAAAVSYLNLWQHQKSYLGR